MSLLSTLRSDFPEGLMRAYPAGRGDEQFLHVGDLFQCPTFVKARLNGAPMLPPSPYVMSMFQMGHAMEDVIVNSVRETIPGAKIERDVLLWVSAHDGDLWGGRLARDAYAHGYLVSTVGVLELDPRTTIVGHADAIVTHEDQTLLIEAKSERFQWTQRPNGQWVAIPPSSPKDKYVDQGAVYAFADQIHEFAVVVGDRVSGGVEWFPRDGDGFNTSTHIETLQARIEALVALGTSDEMPELKRPVAGFEAITHDDQIQIINTECARCPYSGCTFNTNPLRQLAAA